MNGATPATPAVTAITVRGFKSLYDECRVEIRPLTLLAGANNAGKSSIMQPLLLLKQTLEAPYDPGALKLDGPHVTIPRFDEVLARTSRRNARQGFRFEIARSDGSVFAETFAADTGGRPVIEAMAYRKGAHETVLRPGMNHDEIPAVLPPALRQAIGSEGARWSTEVQRGLVVLTRADSAEGGREAWRDSIRWPGVAEWLARHLLHVTTQRGRFQGEFPFTNIDPRPLVRHFSGRFDDYTGSMVRLWQAEHTRPADPSAPEQSSFSRAMEGLPPVAMMDLLIEQLVQLQLTSSIAARDLDDSRVEVLIGRLPQRRRGAAKDLMRLGAAGSGAGQALSVLVALLAAQDGDLVYIEEPEMSLHPRAQCALAAILAAAATRGVRVVAETHSSLLLLGVESLVAEQTLDPSLVKLHWFSRNEQGVTRVDSADLDAAGRFGDWPEDFAETELRAESRYLDAAEAQLGLRAHGA